MGVGPLVQLRLARWVRRAQRGDTRAFSALFSSLHPLVYGYMAARVRVRADAEELTATALHRFVDRIERYDAGRGGVRGWVMTIARNVLIDHLRKASRHEVAPFHDVDALADARFAPDAGEEDPRLHDVRTALADYPATTREMFALRYGDGLRIREIATVLGMSEAAVKQRFSRTLEALRRHFDDPTKKEEVSHAPS